MEFFEHFLGFFLCLISVIASCNSRHELKLKPDGREIAGALIKKSQAVERLQHKNTSVMLKLENHFNRKHGRDRDLEVSHNYHTSVNDMQVDEIIKLLHFETEHLKKQYFDNLHKVLGLEARPGRLDILETSLMKRMRFIMRESVVNSLLATIDSLHYKSDIHAELHGLFDFVDCGSGDCNDDYGGPINSTAERNIQMDSHSWPKIDRLKREVLQGDFPWKSSGGSDVQSSLLGKLSGGADNGFRAVDGLKNDSSNQRDEKHGGILNLGIDQTSGLSGISKRRWSLNKRNSSNINIPSVATDKRKGLDLLSARQNALTGRETTDPTQLGRNSAFGRRPQTPDVKCENEIEQILSEIGQNISNQTSQTLMNRIQKLYCPLATCGKRKVTNKSPNRCDSCNCGEDCSRYGNCCIDETAQPPDKNWICVSQERKYKNDTGVYMIGTCPNTYLNLTIKGNCETNNRDTLFNLLPVSAGFNVYKNRFCAICNNNTEFINWHIEIVCTTVLSISSSLQLTEAYDHVINEWPCKVQTKIPTSISQYARPPRCIERNPDSIISECNVTGQWVDYNPHIERACKLYTNVFSATYKNVFCYLCNRNNYSASCPHTGLLPGSSNSPFVSMTEILGFEIGKTVAITQHSEDIECHRGFRYDKIQGECREMYCSPGKWYNGSHCKEIAVTEDDGKIYLAEMILRPTTDVNFSQCFGIESRDRKNLITAIRSFLTETEYLVDTMKHQIKSVITSLISIHNSDEPYEIKVIEILSREHIDCRDGHDNTKSQFTGVKMVLRGFWTTIHLELKGGELRDKFLGIVTNFLSIQPQVVSPHLGYNLTFINDRNATYHLRQNEYPSVELKALKHYFAHTHSFKPFIKLHFCPYIILKKSDCTFLNGGKSIQITSNIGSSNQDATEMSVLVEYEDFEIIDETTVYVCSDVYFRLQTNLTYSIGLATTRNQVEGMLSLVLTCLSMVCLILTIAVYCILKSLRSVPGLNNMSLSITLLLAQALFQFGANQTNYPTVCKIIGVLVHYLWLSVILWMNVCSFHMFKVFGFFTKPTLDSCKYKQFLRYVLYCISVPILLIIGNVSASLTSSNLRNIGYGDTICYINNKYLLALTFALPVGLVIVSNIIMFTIVVISIRRQASTSSFAASDKDYLSVYFRLSTVTGATWLFGFIYQWSGKIIFSYLFIAFNATQGVFVFFAFVVSRPILKKLKVHFFGKKIERSTTSTTLRDSVQLESIKTIEAL